MNIPTFPEFKLLDLNDRDYVHEIIRNSHPITSELTFTNLFMWRHSYRFQVSNLNDILIILACPETRHFMFPPVGINMEGNILHELHLFMKKKDWEPRFERFPANIIEKLNLYEDSRFDINPNRDDFDYVYFTKNLVELSGRKFHKKKNHLNAFLRSCSFEFEPMDYKNIHECIAFQSKWCAFRKCQETEGLFNEDMAVYEALRSWQALDTIRGGLIRIDGKVEALSFGEPLNADTFVVHVEKANPEIRGLYVAINKLCCEKIWPEFKFVNREQDMGVKAIRKAKLSYNPCKMIKKYIVRPSKN